MEAAVKNPRMSRPSPALVISIISLVVALGGTAYAVNSINGRLITRHSIPANRLVSHSVGAGQINKKSLGTVLNTAKLGGRPAGSYLTASATAVNANELGGVPAGDFLSSAGTAANASALGGIGAGGFVQGSAHATLGVADAPVSAAAGVCGESVGVPQVTIATVAGFGAITGFCAGYNDGAPICGFEFQNSSGQTLSGMDHETLGGEGIKTPEQHIAFVEIANGEPIAAETDLPDQSALWQLGIAGSSPLTMTAIVTDSHPEAGASACHFQAQVMTSG